MKWLLLMHQIPPKPDAARVKIWRRLQRAFAVQVKNSVYALPLNKRTRQALGEIAREIEEHGGEAVLCEASFVYGKSSEDLKSAYNSLLSASLTELAKTLRELNVRVRKQKREHDLMPLQHKVSWATSMLKDLSDKNFLNHAGEQVCRELLNEISKTLSKSEQPSPRLPAVPVKKKESYRGRTWVTRKSIAYDRIASAWLIRRHIDADAEFLFVDPKTYKKSPAHISFDMHGGDFTHEGELCTFEVLIKRFNLKSPPLKVFSRIIHDLDIQDDKYQHPKTNRVKDILDGIITSTPKDVDRLKLGFKSLDYLEDSLRSL